MSHEKLSEKDKKRVEKFLSAFSNENKSIRDALVSELPFYNELLQMKAFSFREFALMPVAIEQGYDVTDPLFSYDTILPPCPNCQEKKKIKYKKHENIYECSSCKFTYTANWNSITSGTKLPPIVWLKLLHCILEQKTVEQSMKYCGVARETYFLVRHKLLYGMKLMMDDVKLYGSNVQVDNKFIGVSYKGQSLSDDYPEDSVFDELVFIPRDKRERGGSYSYKDLNANSVCIFVAVDEFGHVMTRFAGIGKATFKRLKKTVGNNKILKTVPDKDPFPFQKELKNPPQIKPGETTVIIADKEPAIERFTKDIDIPLEAHVFRQGNVQRRLSANAHDIQRANNLCKKLDKFLADSNYVSSKYLPAFLTLFEFKCNTNASPEAIKQLFCILSKPGTGNINEKFFEEFFSIPNQYIQYLEEDNPLKKIPYDKLNMYYLYAKRQDMIKSGLADSAMQVKEICEICNCTPQQVRRNYKNLNISGFDSLIRDFFEMKEQDETENNNIDLIKPDNGAPAASAIELAMFDDWAVYRTLHTKKESNFEKFVDQENAKYHSDFTPRHLQYVFDNIVIFKLRPSLPEFKKRAEMYEIYLEEYEERIRTIRSKGETPKPIKVIAEVAEKFGFATETMKSYLVKARAARRANMQ